MKSLMKVSFLLMVSSGTSQILSDPFTDPEKYEDVEKQRHYLPGSHYCTYAPDDTCYIDGWPQCCLDDSLTCPKDQPGCDVNQPPGSSYCTYAPDDTCYIDGWPQCCLDDSLTCPKDQPECDINQPPGSSYCTYAPDDTCYIDGWPQCCMIDAATCPKKQPECDIKNNIRNARCLNDLPDMSHPVRGGEWIWFTLDGTNVACTDDKNRLYSYGEFEEVVDSDSCADQCVDGFSENLYLDLRGYEYNCATQKCRCLHDAGAFSRKNYNEFHGSSSQGTAVGSIEGTTSFDANSCYRRVGLEILEGLLDADKSNNSRALTDTDQVNRLDELDFAEEKEELEKMKEWDELEIEDVIGEFDTMGQSCLEGIIGRPRAVRNGARFRFNLQGMNTVCSDERNQRYHFGAFDEVFSEEDCANKCVNSVTESFLSNLRGFEWNCDMQTCHCLVDVDKMDDINIDVFDSTNSDETRSGKGSISGTESEIDIACYKLVQKREGLLDNLRGRK